MGNSKDKGKIASLDTKINEGRKRYREPHEGISFKIKQEVTETKLN